MALPTSDAYTAPSGTSVVQAGFGAGGGGGSGGVTGTVWTPERDGSGNVTNASRLAVPLNKWVTIAGALMDDVIQTPRYTTSTGTSGDGSKNIVRAWSSMAHDRTGRKFYVQGGGHSDTSKLENGVYRFDLDKLSFTRFKDRAPTTAWQVYGSGGAFITVNTNPYASIGAGGGEGAAAPLQDNSPGAVHNYGQLVHVPASFAGNTNGWLYQGGWTRSVLDLDTGVYKVCHYWGTDIAPLGGIDWGGGVFAWFDGDSIYHHRGGVNHHRFRLAGSEATTWSYGGNNSFGQLLGAGSHFTSFMPNQYNSCWAELPERRETAFFFHNGTAPAAARIRAGQTIDTGNSSVNWTPYTDAITLTSSDGSLADFTASAFHDSTVFPPANGTPREGDLASCGTAYDHAAGCIYIQGNDPGSKFYRVTGIAGSTWDVSTVSGVAALTLATQFTFGRFRVQTHPDGTKFAYRLTSTTAPMEALRLV